MRKTTLTITLLALGAGAFAALRAPAVAPPDVSRALAAQRELATGLPGDPQIQNDLGNLLVLAGKPEAAEEAYRRALEIAPDMTSARYNLALLLIETERPKAALAELRRVVEAEPGNAWAHYQIGVVLDGTGSGRRAVKHYGRAFRLDPQLAFPEVNPHVIQNKRVTEAMLLAYEDLPLAAQAPKSYEQAGRIVSLMMPPEEAPPAALAEGAAAGTPPRSAFPPASTEAPGMQGEPGEGGARVLREEDLERGDVNRVVVPGGVYVPPQPRGGTRAPVRTFTPPDSQGRQPGALPEPTEPGRQRFVPGAPSTGRLEIELVPGASPDDQVAPAG
ncbi:MAG TPA: tetratricopeptide repeat protein [Thermoanaerobaculia bacterium]|nr:tetratricopeptide repeat protein [Thermoanaerobaculia bacterium]